jgi:hypothetical protein
MMDATIHTQSHVTSGNRPGWPSRAIPHPVFYIFTLALFLIFGFGPNFYLATYATIVFAVGVTVLWRPKEPPVLLALFCYQWLQVAIGVYWGNALGRDIETLFRLNGQQAAAAALSLSGLLVLSLGMSFAAGRPAIQSIDLAQHMGRSVSTTRWMWVYICTAALAFGSYVPRLLVPGLSQLFEGISSLKWAGYFMFTYAVFISKNNKKMWFFAFAFELIEGLGGFFSTFKEVFLYTLLAVAAARTRPSPRTLIIGILLALPAIYLALIWTSVKGEYREFVNGGQKTQAVSVGYKERLEKLGSLAVDVDTAALVDAGAALVARLSYTEFFGVALDYVPQIVPHTNGALWLDAIRRPVTPRIFFPDKTAIDESQLTNRYTGLEQADMSEGTQISLGYAAESYVDFGRLGMMVPMAIVGLVLGWVYRWCLTSRLTMGLMGMGLSCAILASAALIFESSSAKLVGGLFAVMLASWLAVKFVVPHVAPWLQITAPKRLWTAEKRGIQVGR